MRIKYGAKSRNGASSLDHLIAKEFLTMCNWMMIALTRKNRNSKTRRDDKLQWPRRNRKMLLEPMLVHMRLVSTHLRYAVFSI